MMDLAPELPAIHGNSGPEIYTGICARPLYREVLQQSNGFSNFQMKFPRKLTFPISLAIQQL